MRKIATLSLLALALSAPALAQEAAPPAAPAPAPAAAASTLPGGANSTTEVHGDWTVDCRMAGEQKNCVMSQALGDSQTGQRVMALELAARTIDQSQGMLLAPFGLRLADGVQLAIDGTPLGTSRPFLTCVPTGCLVPVSFNQSELSALRAGTKLAVAGVNADGSQPVALEMSLAGFTAAHNRVVTLSQ